MKIRYPIIGLFATKLIQILNNNLNFYGNSWEVIYDIITWLYAIFFLLLIYALATNAYKIIKEKINKGP